MAAFCLFRSVVYMDGFEIKIDFPGKKKLFRKLEDHPKAMAKALRRTVSDFKSRAPGWVSSAVTSHYTIKKSDVRSAVKAKEKAGSVKVGGVSVDGARIKYEGGLLTPTHFQMTPKERPAKPYTVKAKIKKDGSKKVLSPIAFLGSANGSAQIPFQRKGESRLPVEAIKTTSVPQMIENDSVTSDIAAKISEGLTKRLEHNMQQAIKDL